ncbi:MAG: hypothetical protein M1831_000512, partial [Alyxoria varia]
LCLSHYCELHGPQSILCTQAVPEPCQSCAGKDGSISLKDYESVESTKTAKEETGQRSPTPSGSEQTPRPLEFGSLSNAPNIDENVRACNGCSMRVPQEMEKKTSRSASSDGDLKDEAIHRNPVLRTRSSLAVPNFSVDRGTNVESEDEACMSDDQDEPAPAMTRSVSRVSSGSEGSPPDVFAPQQKVSPRSIPTSTSKDPESTTISSTHVQSTSSLLNRNLHNHYLNYFSTSSPTDYSIFTPLRQSVVRALSLENLPRGCQSGPLFFGSGSRGQHHEASGKNSDGYAIAYVFRLPDLQARGHRRTYALIAMPKARSQTSFAEQMSTASSFSPQSPTSPSTRGRSFSASMPYVSSRSRAGRRGSGLGSYANDSEARAGAAMASVTAAFAKIASWITKLVETKQNAEKVAAEEAEAEAQAELAKVASQESGGRKIPQFKVTPTSSFLTAKRVDPDGHPRQGKSASGRGGGSRRGIGSAGGGRSGFWSRHGVHGDGPSSLAEMTGKEDIFVQLHVAFVRLILALR